MKGITLIIVQDEEQRLQPGDQICSLNCTWMQCWPWHKAHTKALLHATICSPLHWKDIPWRPRPLSAGYYSRRIGGTPLIRKEISILLKFLKWQDVVTSVPCHEAKVVQGFEKHNDKSAVSTRPPNSPDLNPSEHLGVCWTDLQRSRQRSLKDVKDLLLTSWFPDTIAHLFLCWWLLCWWSRTRSSFWSQTPKMPAKEN